MYSISLGYKGVKKKTFYLFSNNTYIQLHLIKLNFSKYDLNL